MAYDEGLAQRLREVLGDRPDMVEKKMFGGVGVMLDGNMACGVHGDRLIVRVGPERYETALSMPHAGEFDITGRPMRGWITVGPGGYDSDDELAGWVQQGVDFALTLPPK